MNDRPTTASRTICHGYPIGRCRPVTIQAVAMPQVAMAVAVAEEGVAVALAVAEAGRVVCAGKAVAVADHVVVIEFEH